MYLARMPRLTTYDVKQRAAYGQTALCTMLAYLMNMHPKECKRMSNIIECMQYGHIVEAATKNYP